MVAANDKKVIKSFKRSKSNNKKLSKSHIPTISKHKDDNYLEESDGTWIKVLSNKNNIKHLKINSPNQTQFDCWYFGESTEEYESVLADKLNKLRTDAVAEHGMAVVGFDTEGFDSLMQLGSGRNAVLIHRSSGLMDSECLKSFLANQKILFVGADVAKDALLLPIHGLYDLTPIFSVLYPIFSHLQVEIRNDFEVLDACEGSAHSVSLKAMYKKVYDKTWVKGDLNHGYSWGCPDLTLSQLKYAALDAWVSRTVGVYVVQRFAAPGLFKHVFTTLTLSEQLRVVLWNVHRKTHIIMGLYSDSAMSVLSVKMLSNTQVEVEFANSTSHIREGDVVLFTLYHPQGSKTGVRIKGEVVDVIGQGVLIALAPVSTDKRLIASDANVRRCLLKDPASFLVSVIEGVLLGGVSSHTSGSPKGRRGQSKQVLRVVVSRFSKDAAIFPTIRRFIMKFIHGHIVSKDLFTSVTAPIPLPEDKEVTSSEVAEKHNLKTSLYILSKDRSLAGAVRTLSTDAYRQALARVADERALNPQQLLAVKRALGHSVSVISGPPGTGKKIWLDYTSVFKR